MLNALNLLIMVSRREEYLGNRGRAEISLQPIVYKSSGPALHVCIYESQESIRIYCAIVNACISEKVKWENSTLPYRVCAVKMHFLPQVMQNLTLLTENINRTQVATDEPTPAWWGYHLPST